MRKLEELEPKEVFRYFEDICEIPHGSRHTAALSDCCVDFALEQGLKYRQDEAGNVIIWKPAFPGREEARPIILQGHLDMVTVKEDGCMVDLERDPVPVNTDGAYVFADGTSLGGDDGIAVAYILALLASETISHPALIAVLTVDEEIGMLGATALDPEGIDARHMLNIDSEEEGYILAGCAGGATVHVKFPAEKETVSGFVSHLQFSHLTGGHSGEEIDKERLNANVLFGRFLSDAPDDLVIRFGDLSGGKKDNAIAQNFSAVLVVPEEKKDLLMAYMDEFRDTILWESGVTDPDAELLLRPVGVSKADVIRSDQARAIGAALTHLPNGVQRRMPGMTELVETSLNLGVIRETEDEEGRNILQLTYCVRSAANSQKESLIRKINDLALMLGGNYEISGIYPAWEYRRDSDLRDVLSKIYRAQYGTDAQIKTIHAGLECGILASKIPDLDCVSIGPDIHDIHTTREKMDVASVQRTWQLVVSFLESWDSDMQAG